MSNNSSTALQELAESFGGHGQTILEGQIGLGLYISADNLEPVIEEV